MTDLVRGLTLAVVQGPSSANPAKLVERKIGGRTKAADKTIFSLFLGCS